MSRDLTAEIDSHPANPTDLLNPRKFELPLTERLHDVLAFGGVPESDADSVAQWKSAHLVIAIRQLDRIVFEHLLFAFRHYDAIAAVEFFPDNPWRNLPMQPSDDVLPP